MDRADIRIVIGKTGSGKSVKVNGLIAGCDRIVMFDTQNKDFTDGVMFEEIEPFKKFWLEHYRGKFRLIYRPINPLVEFEQICELAFACGDMMLVAEELPSLCDSRTIGEWFRKVIFRGRARDIRFIGTMQRPKGIHRDLTSQATEIYIFETDEPGDIKYFSDRLPSGIEEKIRQLEQYQYVHWQSGSTELEIGKDSLEQQ